MRTVRAEPVEARLFDRLRANGLTDEAGRINNMFAVSWPLKLEEATPHIKDTPGTAYPFSIGRRGCILALTWQNDRHGGW